MQTHRLGRLYTHMVRLTGAPLVHRGKSSMTQYPYYWAHPVIIRLPFGRGLVIGWWHKHEHLDVTSHLAGALSLCPVDCPDLPTEDAYYGADPERVL